MEKSNIEIEERHNSSLFQFHISQIMLWTAATAIFITCMKYLVLPMYAVVLLAFLYVPIAPIAILFIAITLSPEKKGYLSVDYLPIKVLFVAWIISLIVAVLGCFLLDWSFLF